jgi:hypothetical protein
MTIAKKSKATSLKIHQPNPITFKKYANYFFKFEKNQIF